MVLLAMGHDTIDNAMGRILPCLHRHFAQLEGLGGKCNVQAIRLYRLLKGFITQTGELQKSDRLIGTNLVFAVDIAHAAILSIVDDNVDKGHGLAVLGVSDFSGDRMLLRKKA